MSVPSPIAASTIAAQAFRFMEMSAISSFDDDTEKAAAAREQYETALDQCLEAADWSFASRLVNLPEATATAILAADPDLPHIYALPGDLVMIRQVGRDGSAWRRDLEYLRADTAAPLRLRYTARTTSESSLPATFRVAVAVALALLLAPRWLTTQTKIALLEEKYRLTLKIAMRQDSRMASEQRYDGRPIAADWATEAIR